MIYSVTISFLSAKTWNLLFNVIAEFTGLFLLRMLLTIEKTSFQSTTIAFKLVRMGVIVRLWLTINCLKALKLLKLTGSNSSQNKNIKNTSHIILLLRVLFVSFLIRSLMNLSQPVGKSLYNFLIGIIRKFHPSDC